MKFIYCLVLISLNYSIGCRSPGIEIFGKKSPHEKYGQKIKDAGLHETALGRTWFIMADQSLQQPVNINLPYRETGYFPDAKADASGYSFSVKRGELINIFLEKLPMEDFEIFMDLWQLSQDSILEMLDFADTSHFNYEVENDGQYVLRLQPELLKSGTYTLTIKSGPSLAFPVQGKESIQSFWGATRDGGNRSHEGVDIFAPRNTPVLAAADGRINRVNLNNLGGKVIFMRPKDKNISLYYAHLDSQLVKAGQSVQAGDTIGLVGNTGNAITTSPHLHFGIYTSDGAIDPLPFINHSKINPPAIRSSTENLGRFARTDNRSMEVKSNEMSFQVLPNTLIYLQAAFANQFKVRLPDSVSVFIPANRVNDLIPIRKMKISGNFVIYEQPHTKALQIGTIFSGDEVNVMGNFNNYYYITNANGLEGWLKQ